MMSFEDVLDKHKQDLIESLILFSEGKRINKVLVDLERNRPELYKFYEAGKQSKQDELNKLIEIINWQLENSELILSVDENNMYEKGYKDALLLIKSKLQRE